MNSPCTTRCLPLLREAAAALLIAGSLAASPALAGPPAATEEPGPGLLCKAFPVPGPSAADEPETESVAAGVVPPRWNILLEQLRRSEREGLHPEDYHLANLEARVQALRGLTASEQPAPPVPGLVARLDAVLSDALYHYASHLYRGRVSPDRVHPDWAVAAPEEVPAATLRASLEQSPVEHALEELRPRSSGYAALVEALEDLRKLRDRGGWPRLPEEGLLQPGERSSAVAALRARLVASGELAPADDRLNEGFFDEAMEAAVRRFQARHGQKADGVVGPTTLASLNVSVEERIRQIELNLERWRWLPRDLGDRYIMVNTADFALQVVEEGEVVLRMRVIAGKRCRRTPLLSAEMTHLVLNPYWHVPRRIATRDLLPKIQEDPGYLEREHIRVFGDWNAPETEIDPRSVDWTQLSRSHFPYRLRQDPGDGNALGKVKFLFPNRFSVYLHDTPARSLFERRRRDFSSGCIRVEKPLELAAYLLGDEPHWSPERLQHRVERGEHIWVRLSRPIPVYLLYWTAWVDESGEVQFRDDVYGRDRQLEIALARDAADPT